MHQKPISQDSAIKYMKIHVPFLNKSISSQTNISPNILFFLLKSKSRVLIQRSLTF